MEFYVPDCYQVSILKINYKKLYDKGIRVLLFDLDNTIAPFNEKSCNPKIKDLFNMLKEKGMKIIIFSNSPKKRVEIFSNDLEVDYMSCAGKPFPKKFLEIIKMCKAKESEVAIIGDQLLTDIKGGNQVGIFTILVDPISDYDPFFTKISRKKEKRIKTKLRDKGLFKGRHYEEKV